MSYRRLSHRCLTILFLTSASACGSKSGSVVSEQGRELDAVAAWASSSFLFQGSITKFGCGSSAYL